MWTNPETSPRALRSNSGGRVRPFRAVLVASVILIALPLSAQQTDTRAYLIEQPRFSQSMELFPANRIANYSARYQVGDESMRVFVAAADQPSVAFMTGNCEFAETENWAGFPSDRTGDTADSEIIRYAGDSTAGYDVYVLVPTGASWSCAALEQFIRDFSFFATIEPRIQEALRRVSVESPTRVHSGTMQFPAILEFGIP